MNKDIKHDKNSSRDAMLSLLRLAQQKIETGVTTEFPLDDISRAKRYFYNWHIKKTFKHNKLIGAMAGVAAFYVSFTSESLFWIVILFFSGLLYSVAEWDKRKLNYVKHLIGNTSNLEGKDRKRYLHGLVDVLWRVEAEVYSLKKIIITSLFK
ncbi:MAG: hypothetical protein Q9M36_02745 [Sulfurovum sp.]|nr:hypothetical protein [Sulfurovum sp.]